MPRTQLDLMAQVAGGAQASYVVPGTNQRVSFFVQGQGSLTASGQGVTADGQIAFGFQGNF